MTALKRSDLHEVTPEVFGRKFLPKSVLNSAGKFGQRFFKRPTWVNVSANPASVLTLWALVDWSMYRVLARKKLISNPLGRCGPALDSAVKVILPYVNNVRRLKLTALPFSPLTI